MAIIPYCRKVNYMSIAETVNPPKGLKVFFKNRSKYELVAAMQQQSPSQIAWRRLKSNKIAMAGLFISLFFIIMAFGAPLFTNLFGVNDHDLYPVKMDEAGVPLAPFNGASWHHPLGFEPGTGRDLFALISYGSRISFTIAAITTLSAVILGTILGIISALVGGRVDNMIGRVADFVFAFPVLLTYIALTRPLVFILEHSTPLRGNSARILLLIVFFTIFGWPGMYRIIRSQVLTIREKEFVLASRALGASNSRIVFREILPNLWPILIVYLTNSLPGYLSAEATYSFLGIGVQAPAATFGLILNDALNFWQRDLLYLVIPASIIVVIVLALNFFGDGLRDALDTKSDR